MNSIFSVEDLELLWQGPVTEMSRSASEWELEKFLEEFPASSSSVINGDININNNHHHNNGVNVTVSASTAVSSSRGREDDVIEIEKPSESDNQRQPLDRGVRPIGGKDTDDYHTFLKSQLDLACAAAAAKSMGLNVKAEGVSVLNEDQSLAANKNSCQTGSPVSGNGPGVLKGQNEIDGRSDRVSAVPALPKKQEIAARQATSVSSREDSDDDELEGDTGNNDNMDPSNDKRARRMQSNRESARRSRRRKQAQLTDLEAQVGQLRDERTSLLTRLTDINKKCDDASVDNRILNANIETLRTKVKMAEDQVKRVTGLSPLALGRSSMPSMGMQFVSGQTDPSANVGLPVQPNNHHFFHHPVPDLTSGAPHLQRLNNDTNLNPLAPNLPVDNGTSNVGRMASMQQLAGAQSTADVPPLQHAHKQSRSTVKLPAAVPVNNNGPSQPIANDNKKN